MEGTKKWIPCRYRLPELGELVLTKNSDGYLLFARLVDIVDDVPRWSREDVVAWMSVQYPPED